MATSTGSSARKVLSSTRPVRTFLSRVRTKAPPLPGLTCWNSSTFMRLPSMLRVIPFLRSLVVGMGAPGLQFEQILGRSGEDLVAVGADDRQVLDPDAAEAGEVDTGFHGHGRPGRDPTTGVRAHPRRLVDLQPDPVAGRVA